jgi:hypothetical protein
MPNVPVTPFFLENFRALGPDGVTPRSRFANGEKIALAWDSNGTAFKVYAGQDNKPVTTTARSCTMPGRSDTTTFILEATVTGGSRSGTPQEGFETVTLYQALTVVVSNPDLTPSSLTAGTLTVAGASTLKGDASLGNASVGGALGVTGAASLKGGATASALTVQGASTFGGAATLGSASVSGALKVSGPTTLAAATAATITVQQQLAVLNPRQVFAPNSYTANVDGILTGQVGNGGSDPASRSVTWITGSTNTGLVAQATGGNVCQWRSGNDTYMASNPNAFALPVLRGTSFTVGVKQGNNNQVNAPTTFWYFPFGTTASVDVLSELEASSAGATIPPETGNAVYEWIVPDTAIADLLALLSQLLGTDLSEQAAERFAQAVRRLAGESV